MSSTRYADDDEIHQNRWASSPDFSTSISALLAAKRITLIADKNLRSLLWFIQWRSLQPRGLRSLAEEIIATFPERLGTPAMRRLRLKRGKKLSRRQTIELRQEFPDGDSEFQLRSDSENEEPEPGWVYPDYPEFYLFDDFLSKVTSAAEGLHEHLMRLCVDPSIKLERRTIGGDGHKLTSSEELDEWLRQHPPSGFWHDDRSPDVWYFADLLGALKLLRSNYRTETRLADTEATAQIIGTLDFCLRRRRMALIEGKAGIGKTETIKAWCDQQKGLARAVEVPSSNDDRSFFAAIAGALGVARGASQNGQQIKLRVEDALRASGLMLVFDEAQFAWPQYMRPQGIPSRIQWIKTAFDAGTPIALVALPKFSEWRELYAKRTLWDDDQLERRINRTIRLPDAHTKEDLLKIARARHSNGNKASWTLLVGYAMAATKKQASAITEALESAGDIAHQQGRESITYDDIDAAIKLHFKPLETTQPASSPKARRIEGNRKDVPEQMSVFQPQGLAVCAPIEPIQILPNSRVP